MMCDQAIVDGWHTDVVGALREALPNGAVLTGDDIPVRNENDSSRLTPVRPLALVRPGCVEDLVAAVRVCSAFNQPIVTQGGLTGMVGGGRPQVDEVAISLERMTGIIEVDSLCATITAHAGTPLYVVQRAAAEIGMSVGIDLGARGSCTVGGIVATNAGGHNVVRYGMTRNHVMGLEVVLPDGTVMSSLKKVIKDNAGYNWKQLMIGSEGTLGIVTKVILALEPPIRSVSSAILGVENTQVAIHVLRKLQEHLPARLLAFEAMWSEFVDTAVRYDSIRVPLSEWCDVIVLIDIEGGDTEAEQLEGLLSDLFNAGLLKDAVIAQSETERIAFWELRESIYEFGKKMPSGPVFDISIPADRMERAIELFRDHIPKSGENVEWVVFGHLADNNIHIRLGSHTDNEGVATRAKRCIYEIVSQLDGSISAEHGIGALKIDYLANTRTAEEIALMQKIKKAVDPKNIFNRNRVFPIK